MRLLTEYELDLVAGGGNGTDEGTFDITHPPYDDPWDPGGPGNDDNPDGPPPTGGPGGGSDADNITIDESKLSQPLTPEQQADVNELRAVMEKYANAIRALPDNAILRMPNGFDANGNPKFVEITGADLKNSFRNSDIELMDSGSRVSGAKFAMDWNDGDPKIMVSLDGLRENILSGKLSETIGHEIGHMTSFNRENWIDASADGNITPSEVLFNQSNATRLGLSLQLLMGEDVTGHPYMDSSQPRWQIPS